MKGIIYKATNTFNGKVYIGQTIAGLPKRKSQHYKDAKSDSDNIFHVALYQYPNAFEWETIDTFTGTREEVIHSLNVAEEYHILKCNSTDERYGYNATSGGYSSDKFAEHIKKRAQMIGGDAKPVLQYDLEGNFIREFSSLNEVAASLNRDKVSPKDIITGIHYGSQWRMKKNEYFLKNIGEYRPQDGTRKLTPIIAYDSEGMLIKRFVCVEDAERETGITSKKILEQSRGKTPGEVSIQERNKRKFYFFRDTDEYQPKIDILVITKKVEPISASRPQKKRFSVFSFDGDIIETGEFYSSELEKKYHTARTTIKKDCKSSLPLIVPLWLQRKFFFRYADESVEKIQIVKQEKKTQIKPKMEHRIIQYTLDGEFVKVWDNTYQAAEAGMDTHAIIRKVLRGIETRKSPNYLWRFFSEDYPQKIEAYEQRAAEKEVESIKTIETRPDDTIEELNWTGEVVAVYRNTADAAKNSGCSQSYICNVLAGKIKHPKRRFRRKAS